MCLELVTSSNLTAVIYICIWLLKLPLLAGGKPEMMFCIPHSVVDNQLFLCFPSTLWNSHHVFFANGAAFFKQHLKIPPDTSNVLGAHETVA